MTREHDVKKPDLVPDQMEWDALWSWHRDSQYEFANKEDYEFATYHKNRAAQIREMLDAERAANPIRHQGDDVQLSADGNVRGSAPRDPVRADQETIRSWASQRGLAPAGARLDMEAVNRKRVELGQAPFELVVPDRRQVA